MHCLSISLIITAESFERVKKNTHEFVQRKINLHSCLIIKQNTETGQVLSARTLVYEGEKAQRSKWKR